MRKGTNKYKIGDKNYNKPRTFNNLIPSNNLKFVKEKVEALFGKGIEGINNIKNVNYTKYFKNKILKVTNNNNKFKSIIIKVNNGKGEGRIIDEAVLKKMQIELINILKPFKIIPNFTNCPKYTTTKKGILIRMGKGKGKAISNHVIMPKGKIFAIIPISNTKENNNIQILISEVKIFLRKYSFLSYTTPQNN